MGIAFWMFNNPNIDSTLSAASSAVTFGMYIGTAISFTAFSVLARILTATNLISTPMGMLAMSIAAIDDCVAWCVLAVVLSVSTGADALIGVYSILIVVAFFFFVYFAIMPFVKKWMIFLSEEKDEMNRVFVAVILFLVCACAFVAEGLGVHGFFGSFILGLMLPREGKFVHIMAQKIELLIVEFFLPLVLPFK